MFGVFPIVVELRNKASGPSSLFSLTMSLMPHIIKIAINIVNVPNPIQIHLLAILLEISNNTVVPNIAATAVNTFY